MKSESSCSLARASPLNKYKRNGTLFTIWSNWSNILTILKIHNLIIVNQIDRWSDYGQSLTISQRSCTILVIIDRSQHHVITTHKVVTNKKQGPGRGHPWSSDRNRAEFPVSAWEVKLKTMKLQKEIGWSCFKNEFHQKYDIDCRKSITTNAFFYGGSFGSHHVS